MMGQRWIVGVGALLVAALALYLLLTGTTSGVDPGTKRHDSETMTEIARPALDNIDAKSRSAMRDLLRETDTEE